MLKRASSKLLIISLKKTGHLTSKRHFGKDVLNAAPEVFLRNITLEGVQPDMEDIKTQLESSIIFEETNGQGRWILVS